MNGLLNECIRDVDWLDEQSAQCTMNAFVISGPTEQLGGLFRTRTRKLPVPFQITRNFRDSAVPRNTVISAEQRVLPWKYWCALT